MRSDLRVACFKSRRMAAAILTASLMVYGCGGAEERQADYYQKAQSLYEAGDYEKARIEVRNVLQINANNADARYLMALLEEKDRNWRGMFGNLNAALENNPDHIDARIKLSQLYVASGDLNRAMEEVEEVLKRNPDSADAYAVKASIFQRKQEMELAKEAAEKSLSIDASHVNAIGVMVGLLGDDEPEKALSLINKGLQEKSENSVLKLLKIKVLGDHGRVEEAEAVFDQLIVENPDKLYYPYQYANFLIQSQRREEAEKLLRKTVDQHPDDAQPKIWLVEFLAKNRSTEEARQTLKDFASGQPENYQLQAALAQMHLSAGERGEAKGVYKGVIERERDSADAIDARNQLVKMYLQEKEREPAETLLKEIFELEPENGDALLIQARLKLADKDIDGAIADLRAVLKNQPDDIDAVTLLAASQERIGSNELALDYYQRALAIEPDNMAGLVGTGRLLLADKRIDEAEKHLKLAYQKQPGNLEVVRLLNELYIRQSNWDQAREVAASLLLNQKTAAMGHYLQGRAYAAQSEPEKALQALRQSLEKEPRAVEPLQLITRIYLGTNRPGEALDFVEKHVGGNPDQPHARELLGTLYARSGKMDKAEQTLKDLIEEQPGAISAYRQLGAVYMAQGESAAARSLYQEGLDSNPDNPGLLLLLAELQQAGGEHKGALATYEKLLELQPDSNVIRNNLAVLLIDHFPDEKNLRRAQRLTADLATSDNPVFLDTVGWLQYRLGNYPQALVLLQDAVRKGGAAPVYRYHLGMAYYKSDMKEQAKGELEKALETELSFQGRDEAEQVLQQL